MIRIEPFRQLAPPEVDSTPKGSIVVLLALTALAGVAYYLFQRCFALSIEAQRIRNSFQNPPRGLNSLDLYLLAKKVESMRNQRMTLDERCKVRIFPNFFNLRIRKKFIVYIGPNNTLRVQYIEANLGNGSFGKVVRLVDLYSGNRTALKVATLPKSRRDELAKAEQDLKKEHRNLMIVHRPGHLSLGVQERPETPVLRIFKLYESLTSESVGYEGPLYDGSLDKLQMGSFPKKDRLFIAFQILQGMETLLAHELINHDLKPDNVLFRRVRGSFLVHIGDLGGATLEGHLGRELKSGIAHTSGFADNARLAVATLIPINVVQKSLVRCSEKRSIGVTIFWVLTGEDVTDKSLFREAWRRAELPLDGNYGELLMALEKSVDTGLLSQFFKDNVQGLKKKVEALCRQAI
jgi:hypothetical protein